MVYIGTSGYSYRDWVGPFYPPGTQPGAFLELYALEFAFVELNFSYYSMPRPEQLAAMAARTPPSMVFSVKAHRTITHERPADTAGHGERFREALSSMGERLAAVLLQFPTSFGYEKENRRYLDRVCRELEGLPLAVEFRNGEWQTPSVHRAFADRGLAFVNVDEPDLPRLMAASETVTADLAYLRFHGRNKAAWWSGDNTTRYDYLYSEGELAGWVERIRRIMRQARTLLVSFNNHFRGQSVHNARSLRATLRDRATDNVL